MSIYAKALFRLLFILGATGITFTGMGLTYSLTDQIIPAQLTSLVLAGISLLTAHQMKLLPTKTLLPTGLFTPSHLTYFVLGVGITWLTSQVLALTTLRLVGSEGYAQVQESQMQTSVQDLAFSHLVAAPVVEEVLFRGIAFGVLFSLLRPLSPLLALLTASTASTLLFSVVHLNLVQGALAILLGGFLSSLYAVTGSLWAPILGHMVFNALSWIIPTQGLVSFIEGISTPAAIWLAIITPVVLLLILSRIIPRTLALR